MLPEKPKLEKVEGTTYCKYSVIECKLARLYRNQEMILEHMQKCLKEIESMLYVAHG